MKNKVLSAIIAISLAFIACIEVEAKQGDQCYSDLPCPAWNEVCHIPKGEISGICVRQ